MAKVLTAASVEKLKATGARREIPDGIVPGLYLIVQPTGRKVWAVRYRHGGKPRKLTLDPYPVLQLPQARERARDALLQVGAGIDPGAAKVAAKRAPGDTGERDLIENVAEQFLKRHASKNRTAAESRRMFTKDILPRWRGRRVQDISRRDVNDLLDSIVDAGHGTKANRVLALVRKFFNWCVERDVLKISPAAGVKPPSPERSRDRILSADELRWLWKTCDEIGEPFGPLVKLLLVTGQRLEEVAAVTWRELHLSDQPPSWTIPATRAKNKRQHHVPLPGLAVDILGAIRRVSSPAGYVFTTTGRTAVSGFSRAKDRLAREMLRIAREEAEERGDDPEGVEIPHWTFHDLRRTAASGMARLGIAVHVVEAVLNHKSGAIRGVAAVYNRYAYEPEKMAALEAWGRYMDDLIAGTDAANVVALRA